MGPCAGGAGKPGGIHGLRAPTIADTEITRPAAIASRRQTRPAAGEIGERERIRCAKTLRICRANSIQNEARSGAGLDHFPIEESHEQAQADDEAGPGEAGDAIGKEAAQVEPADDAGEQAESAEDG